MAVSEVRLTDDQQQQLSEILWAYRTQLQRVEVLLEAQLLFANSGRDVHLGVLADLIDEAAVTLSHLDLRRELLVTADNPAGGGAAAAPTLAEISDGSSEPWADILQDHRQLRRDLIAAGQTLVAQSRHTMGTTLELITQMTNGVLDSPVLGYDRSGRTVRNTSAAVLFDGQA